MNKFLIAGYCLTWFVLLGYALSLFVRTRRLEKK